MLADKLHTKAAKTPPSVGLAGLKQDPINYGYGTEYLPPPARRVATNDNVFKMTGSRDECCEEVARTCAAVSGRCCDATWTACGHRLARSHICAASAGSPALM